MKSRVFTITSLLMLVLAVCAAGAANAQTITPGSDVYVKDFVTGGGGDEVVDTPDTPEDQPSGGTEENATSGNPQENTACAEADGRDGAGNPVEFGSDADCADAPVTATIASGDLPFTGFEAGLVGFAGLALLGAGIGMRRLTRNSAS